MKKQLIHIVPSKRSWLACDNTMSLSRGLDFITYNQGENLGFECVS